MSIALFAGSFDPLHLGHLDVIERAGSVCDKLVIGVGVNSSKSGSSMSSEARVQLVQKATENLPFVTVQGFDGLVIDFAKDVGASFLIRGLRAYSDWDYEFSMALANRKMGDIETVFLMAGAGYAHISSTLIREVGGCGRRLNDFLPDSIEEQVFAGLCIPKQNEESN